MGCGVPPIGDPLSCVTDLAGGAASSISGDFFGAIAKDFGQAADSATQWLWGQIGSATQVSLVDGPGRTTFYFYLGLVASIALMVATGLFVVQIIGSVLRQDGQGLRKALTGLLVAFGGASFAIGMTVLLLNAVDALCNGLLQVALGQSMSQLGNHLLGVGVEGAITNPAGVLLLSIVVLVAVVMVWVAMMIRKLLIVVTAVFAPLAFAGGASQMTAGWVRRWIETMVALIVSKLILILIFIIGYGMLFASLGQPANATGAQKITNVAGGVLILAMSGLSPWLAIKMVHFAGGHFDQIHTQAYNASAAPRQAMAVPQKLAQMSRGLPGSPGSAGSSGRDGQSGSTGADGREGLPGKQAPGVGASSGSARSTGSATVGGGAGTASPVSGSAAGGSASAAGAAAAPVMVAVAAKGAANAMAEKTAQVADQSGGGQ
jgi:type IV secretion system protein TrbL